MISAIILAAGTGTKCWPYSPTRNKSFLPIANKPVIFWTVGSLKKNGIQNIIVVGGYRKEQLAYCLDEDVSFVDQKSGRGTVPAVLSALDHVQEDKFLTIYGDVIMSEENIAALISASEESGDMCTALMQPLEQEKPQDWLCARVNENHLEYVLGHPRGDVSHRFAGAFVFDKRLVKYLKKNPGMMSATQVAMMSPDEAHIEDSLQIAIDNGEQISAVETVNAVVDIDKPWHILEANEVWLKYLSGKLDKDRIGKNCKISDAANIDGHIVAGDNCTIGPGVYVEGDLWLGSHSRIVQGAIVEPMVVIGKNSTIRRYCQIDRCTSIGDDGFVGHGAEVSGVIFRKAWAYHYGEYWGVIGESSDLGAATVCGNLRFDDMETAHRVKGRREIPKSGANAAYLGDFVRTGVNTILMPGVKVGPYSVLGAGAMIQEDVPDKSLIYVEQELVKKSWGPEKYGW